MSGRDIVAYYRVSTREQGFQGLGMAAQREAVARFGEAYSCRMVAAYEEVETGRKDGLANRPELLKAVAHARRAGALLVFARIDRLARSLFVTAQLLNSGVEFVACDNPHANRLTIHILAAMAEHEGRLISERSKAALKAAKARGVVFGRKGRRVEPSLAKLWGEMSAASRRANTIVLYSDLLLLILKLRGTGLSFRAIATALNDAGHCSGARRPLTVDIISGILRRSGFTEQLRRIPGTGIPSPEQQKRASAAAATAARMKSRQAYKSVIPKAIQMRKALKSYAAIARALNAKGYRLSNSALWSGYSVVRLLKREGFRESIEERRRLGQGAGARASALIAEKLRRKNAPFFRAGHRLRRADYTYEEIADRWNSDGHRTRWNTPWSPSSVYAVLKRDQQRRTKASPAREALADTSSEATSSVFANRARR